MDNLRILWVEDSSMLADDSIRPHSHDHWQLMYVKSGSFRFMLDKQTFGLSGGELLLVPANAVHRTYGIESDKIELQEIKFIINNEELKALVPRLKPGPRRDERMGRIVGDIVEEYRQPGKYADKAAISHLCSLLYLLTAELRRSESGAQSSEIIDITRYPEPIQKILLYIEERFGGELPLETIAADMGFNKSYMCSLFKKQVGVTIGEWINIVRIRKAAELLTGTAMSLAQIAHGCGYTSAAHFNRVFQKHMGLPPGQYRRAYPIELHGSADEMERATKNGFLYSVLTHKAIDPAVLRAKRSPDEDE